jgi:hypothetical protein
MDENPFIIWSCPMLAFMIVSCILNSWNRKFGAMEFWIHEMEFDVLNLEFENVLNIIWSIIGFIYYYEIVDSYHR